MKTASAVSALSSPFALPGFVWPASLRRECAGLALAVAPIIAFMWYGWGCLSPVDIFDSQYYINMARQGIWRNPGLVAPFAYRFPAPWVAGLLSRTLHLEVRTAFMALTGVSAALFVLACYCLARAAGARVLLSLGIVGSFMLSFVLFRFHLYWYALIDMEAYVLMAICMLALWSGRPWLGWAWSVVGVHFKEFLIIPGLMVVVLTLFDRTMPVRSRVVRGGAALLTLALSAALPRLLMPVVTTHQFFDPLHANHTVFAVFRLLGDGSRAARVGFSVLSLAFPLLLLLTAGRIRALRGMVSGAVGVQMAVFWGLVAGLSMIGGVGIPRFVSYGFPWVVLFVARLAPAPKWLELAGLLAMVAVFNRVWVGVPNPGYEKVAFSDFYGGDTLSTNACMLSKTLEMFCWIGVMNLTRRLGAFWRSGVGT